MKKFINILLILVLGLGLVACKTEGQQADQGNETTSAIEKIQNKGTLVVGTSADYPPFEWISHDSGSEEYVGVDIELAKKIAEELGVELEIKNMAYEGLVGSLMVDDIDLVIAGMAASPEKMEQVDFSDPYYQGGQVLLVLEENKDSYTSFADLEGKKIGTQLGSTQQGLASEKYGSNVFGYDLNNVLIEQLKNKSIDVAFLSEIPAKQFAAITDGLAIVELADLEDEDGFAVALNKNQDDLRDKISQIIKDLKDSATIQEWLDEYIELSTSQAGK
ncbi:MAG: transporter substrate-binding domain-containing protein [Bacillota bacterium]|nr:transporter substrate-binding domain-containing protein [Bacillota bacterium]